MKNNLDNMGYNHYLWLMLGGAFIGAISYLLIYGITILNVTNDNWLFSGEDISQHYFGWLYYRKSDWKFPIGMMDGLVDLDISVIFMDSIPLLALLFKIFRNLLPNNFQYFGIWGIFSFTMMGGLASVLLYKFTKNKLYCWIGSIFFVLSPYVVQRMYIHTSLGGQWIIILAMLIWVYNFGDNILNVKILAWTGTLCVAALTHLYFVPMTCVFCFIDAVRYVVNKKNIFNGCLIVGVPICFALIELYVMGGFSGTGDYHVWGLGYYSANINSLFNPMNISLLFPTLPAGEGQGEGLGYLGTGMILLVVINILLALKNRERVFLFSKHHKIFIVCSGVICFVFCVLAFSPTITFGDHILFVIKWPQLIMKVLGIFRASGRFIWVVSYMIFLLLIFGLVRMSKSRVAVVILTIICCVQIIDMSPLIQERHAMFSGMEKNQETLDTDSWNLIFEGKKKLVFVPWDTVYSNSKMTYALGRYAYINNIQFNSFYVSRPDSDRMTSLTNSYIEAINQGNANHYVFVFYDKNTLLDDTYKLFYYNIDGIIVGVTERVDKLNKLKM
ncbi:DUF6311 domain-containing protein [Clostridium sp. HBUAS56010]|uniref:DUF6311 domain-containing protein n=1 Tax=Clostridium sp. HBUAS56010 TaxID=2571127 RepID=UPI001177BCA7|nr:DUF6311 domain-containing protein [Clostridium sp. HBUAS56010]